MAEDREERPLRRLGGVLERRPLQRSFKAQAAFDLWNSIPVLVTTPDLLGEARRWVEGSFHEIADAFRLVPWKKVRRFYEAKSAVKELEMGLGVV